MKLRASSLFAAAVTGLFLTVPAHATYIIDFKEAGSNIISTGSGFLNLSVLQPFFSLSAIADVSPAIGEAAVGSGNAQIYETILGPTNIGSGPFAAASLSSGPLVGVSNAFFLAVPAGYVSGTPLGTSTATYDGASFAKLGLTPGSYVWTWGQGTSADSFTVNIGGSAVPEPANWAMLLPGFGLLGGALRYRKRPRARARLAA